MTIGNLSSHVRIKPTSHSIMLVALLPQPIKLRDIPAPLRAQQRLHNRFVIQSVLDYVLRPLMDDMGGQFIGYCADGHYRNCRLVLSGWVADYPEHVSLQNHRYGLCPWCEVPKNSLGEYNYDKVIPSRDHQFYQALYTITKQIPPDSIHPLSDSSNIYSVSPRISNHKRVQSERHSVISSIMEIIKNISKDPIEAARILKQHGINLGDNVLWYTGAQVSTLPKPDLLHTMQLGMLKHLLNWLQQFMKKFKRLERYNEIWLSVPAYLDMTQPKKSYEEITQWTGTELRQISRYLLGVVTNTLRSPSPLEKPIFDNVIQCTRALLEFYLYCRYPTHNTETLDLMDQCLRWFHKYKSVFLQFRPYKKATQQCKQLLKNLNSERDIDMEKYQNLTATQRKLRLDEWNEWIKSEVENKLEEDSSFNFPKLHLMSHFRHSIEKYGSLQQWSTEIRETAHKTQIKDGYRASNKTGDIFKQIINHYMRQNAFAVRRMNLNSNANDPTHHSPPRPLQNNSLSIPAGYNENLPDQYPIRFRSVQQGIKTFVDICNTYHPENILRNQLLISTQAYLKSLNIEITNNSLKASPCTLFHSIDIPTEVCIGQLRYQSVRATGEKGWYSGFPRNDWIWVKIGCPNLNIKMSEPPYKALKGRLPYRLLRAFNLQIDSQLLDLAFVEITKPYASGMPNSVSSMVRVVPPSGNNLSKFKVIVATNICGAAHLIPEVPLSSQERNSGWVVNNHIDLMTWNTVHYINNIDLPARKKVRQSKES
jgi:hypothetical protein